MANIYITSLYYWGTPSPDDIRILTETYELSRDSYLEHLEDIDEHIVFANPGFDGELKGKGAAPHGDVFYDMFMKTYELWQQGHNVFYADIDTICIHPIKIFGEFEKFTMFNGVSTGKNLLGFHETSNYQALRDGYIEKDGVKQFLPTYFNDGVRYFPAETPQAVWDIGLAGWEDWKTRKDMWGEQQIIHNKMLYEGQEWNNDYTTCKRPEFNHFDMAIQQEHQVINKPDYYFNDYHIYHLFSSRGLAGCLNAMKTVKLKGY